MLSTEGLALIGSSRLSGKGANLSYAIYVATDNHIKQMKNKDTYIRVRLTEDQKAKLDALAEDLNTDKSKIIRRQIDNLPDPRNKESNS